MMNDKKCTLTGENLKKYDLSIVLHHPKSRLKDCLQQSKCNEQFKHCKEQGHRGPIMGPVNTLFL